MRFDLLEVHHRARRVDELAVDHGADILQIVFVGSLELPEGLRVGIDVVEAQPALAGDEHAPSLPARGNGDEVIGRRELDVDVDLLLDVLDRPQEVIGLPDEPDVYIDRRAAPAEEDGGRTAGEVAGAVDIGCGSELTHEARDPFGVRYIAHSAARSKLTSRRTSAL